MNYLFFNNFPTFRSVELLFKTIQLIHFKNNTIPFSKVWMYKRPFVYRTYPMNERDPISNGNEAIIIVFP